MEIFFLSEKGNGKRGPPLKIVFSHSRYIFIALYIGLVEVPLKYNSMLRNHMIGSTYYFGGYLIICIYYDSLFGYFIFPYNSGHNIHSILCACEDLPLETAYFEN